MTTPSTLERGGFEFEFGSNEDDGWFESNHERLDYLATLSRYKLSAYFTGGTHSFLNALCVWLQNFDVADRRIALTLATRIFLLSHRESSFLQRCLYQDLRESLPADLTVDNLLFVPLEEDVSTTEFFTAARIVAYKDADAATGGIPSYKSLDSLLQPVKALERVTKLTNKLKTHEQDTSLTEEWHTILAQCEDVAQEAALWHRLSISGLNGKLASSTRQHLVLLTDIAGSGKTVSSDVARILNHFDAVKSVYVLCFVATESALTAIRSVAPNRVRAFAGLKLHDTNWKAEQPKSLLFTDRDTQLIAGLCQKYFHRLQAHPDIKRHGEAAKFGFGESGLLFVRERNCPNNSLPLIWAGTGQWKPLFMRQHSYFYCAGYMTRVRS